jgi:hypothetical protein
VLAAADRMPLRAARFLAMLRDKLNDDEKK